MRRLGALGAALLLLGSTAAPGPTIRFVFTSDAHYGLERPTFRGRTRVDAHDVNAALVADVTAIGPIDFLVEGGDVANREEIVDGRAVQAATESWRQFRADYLDRLAVPVFVVPGNHDVSNAIGFYKPMTPATDHGAMVGMFNADMRCAPHVTPSTYRYAEDPIWFSRDFGGVHFVFVQVWLDSRARDWMERDLAGVSRETPVIVFTHDQPDVEAKHLRNPNPPFDINARDRFENLLADTLADGRTIDTKTIEEQRALEAFLERHPNITAYFHGNSNWNEFYDWPGPSHRRRVHTFRVDSPMKGAESLSDETRLSFQVATIDRRSGRMTVRERLWAIGAWGDAVTVSLRAAGVTQN